MPVVKANGIDMHVRESGHGLPVILFVHALGANLRIWDDVISLMDSALHCISYDLRGHGSSTVTDGPYSLSLLAADLLRLMDALDIAEATICGISIGGLIAQRAALDEPGRVKSLVLCDTGAKIGTPAAWQERIRLVSAQGLAALSGAITARWYSPGFCENSPARHENLRADLAAMSPVGYIAACHALSHADLSLESHKLKLPTLITCGADDIAAPPAVAQALASLIPQAKVEIIPGAGHLPCVETPARLARSIQSFLAEAHIV